MDSKKEMRFEQYKIMIESAGKVTEWRQKMNEFYLTLNSALVTVSAYLFSNYSVLAILIVAAFGILLSMIWRSNIFDLRKLNTAKFMVINEIEEKELKSKLFSIERKYYKELGRRGSTLVESKVPIWFIAIYFAVIILALLKLVSVL